MRENTLTKTSQKQSNIKKLLKSSLDQLSLNLHEVTIEKLLKYIDELYKWNKIYNLTAITDPESILTKHIFDSLAVIPFIRGQYILDFGTGAGLPGIPLALTLPQWNFVLLDSSKKKTTFLNHIVLSLDINNIKVATKRVEEFHFEPLFATIVTRATAKSDIIIEKVKHLCAKSGQILIMKGKYPGEELKFINKPFEVYPLKVPHLNEERHIIKILN